VPASESSCTTRTGCCGAVVAVWPFETLIVPRRRVRHLPDLSSAEKGALTELLSRVLSGTTVSSTTRFPIRLAGTAHPRGAMGLRVLALHGHFYPPLLHSPR